MAKTLVRAHLLRNLGYGHPEAARAAVDVLVARGLTTRRKTGIAATKRARVEAALKRDLVLICAQCVAPKDDRRLVPAADPAHCARCGGSANRIAIDRAAAACRRAGIGRVVVVGGAPGVHTALSELWPDDLGLRIVPGTERHTGRQARTNLAWADVVIVWAKTELDHKVSRLYTKAAADHVIVARRRGIEALAQRLAAFADER